MKLHKASQFALYAALELASDPGRYLSGAGIAKKYGISPHHLAKVMRTLVRSGLVEAERGVGGGYRFAGNVNRTTLLDIIQLFESLESESEGSGNSHPHPLGPARPIALELHNIACEIDALTTAVLDTITLKTALTNTAGPAG